MASKKHSNLSPVSSPGRVLCRRCYSVVCSLERAAPFSFDDHQHRAPSFFFRPRRLTLLKRGFWTHTHAHTGVRRQACLGEIAFSLCARNAGCPRRSAAPPTFSSAAAAHFFVCSLLPLWAGSRSGSVPGWMSEAWPLYVRPLFLDGPS